MNGSLHPAGVERTLWVKVSMSSGEVTGSQGDLAVEEELEEGRRKLVAGKQRFMWGLVLPALAILLAFEIYPVILAFWTSLHKVTIFDPQRPFIGLQNYIRLFTDSHFFNTVIPNTFIFTFVGLIAESCLGVSIAMLLNRRFRGEGVVATLLLFPMMVAPSIAAVLFTWLFNSQFGIVDVVLEAIGIGAVPWLSGRWTAMIVILISDAWLWTPWFAILVLAALKVQPPSPVEAARIDGANTWQVFRYVTLPYLSPVLTICMLIRTFDLFRQFDQTWVITTGGPARSTEFFSIYAYKEVFEYTNYSSGNAAALMGAVVMLIFGIFMYRTFARLTGGERVRP
jgi:multiple sugar transport system permease protein